MNLSNKERFIERCNKATQSLAIISTLAALSILAIRAALRLNLRWDDFWYHIPFAAKRVGLTTSHTMTQELQDFYNGFPPLPDIVQGLLWKITGSLNGVGLINFLGLVLFLWVCHKKLKAPFWVVGILALTTPMVIIHSTVSYIDLFSNSLMAIATCTLAYIYYFKQHNDSQALCICLLGLIGAAWSKYQLVPVVGVFFILCFFQYIQAIPTKSRTKSLYIITIAMLLAAIPYLKNIILYHNPFWPVKIPFIGDYLPYHRDPAEMALVERPRPLAHLSQFKLFFHSLFETYNPTTYANRERWIIDQGNAYWGFRMGGFWYVSVFTSLISAFYLLIRINTKGGRYLTLWSILIICFVALLPQSHELRYYLFIPLTWAGIIGMLFVPFSKKHSMEACFLLMVFVSLFFYSTLINKKYYKIEKINYLKVAENSKASSWWPQLNKNIKYCVVGMEPIGILLTGPTMNDFQIIEEKNRYDCAKNTTLIDHGKIYTQQGSQKIIAIDHLNQSVKYFQNTQYNKCIDSALKALSYAPKMDKAYNNICAAYNKLKKYELAEKACLKAISINPKSVLTKNNLQVAQSMK